MKLLGLLTVSCLTFVVSAQHEPKPKKVSVVESKYELPAPQQKQPVVQEPTSFAEEMPTFKGGDELLFNYLSEHIEYPNIAKEVGEEGTVYMEYVVETDGSISNVKVLRGVSESLDREAKRVVRSMPNWNPAKDKGKVVRCKMVLPVKFILG
ncbi:MAG: energy transducer TonB [Lishizhenia sp.]